MTTVAAKIDNFDAAFAAFLIAAQSASDRDYAAFGGPSAPKLSVEHGRRYVRIVSDNGSQRSAWAFVDMTTGAVLKCDGWKSPAKGSRGNIFDAQNGAGRVRWTGVA